MTFDDLAPGYRKLWQSLAVAKSKLPAANAIVDRIVAAEARYAIVEQATSVPWWVVAAIHSLESDLSFRGHLHNGDSLQHRTVHVPAGRPVSGEPPFTWEASAEDALQFDGLTNWRDWSIAGALYQLEHYNGMGYRRHGINSPYLWSWSNQYARGKFVADGQWSDTAVSSQCGAAVIFRLLADRKLIAPPV